MADELRMSTVTLHVLVQPQDLTKLAAIVHPYYFTLQLLYCHSSLVF